MDRRTATPREELGKEKRQNYLRQKASDAGFDSVDDYINFLRSQQIELQPIEIPTTCSNHWVYVAKSLGLKEN